MKEAGDGAKGRIATYLSSRVNDLCRELLRFPPDDFAEGIFDCRIIRLDEVTVDELNGE